MAKRSTTLKQFLLRVHPDHFRNNPKVHDENLQSVKLLNQFMDEHYAAQGGAGSMSWRRLGAPREKVKIARCCRSEMRALTEDVTGAWAGLLQRAGAVPELSRAE